MRQRRWLSTARSRVGQKLSDLTSQRVVVGILAMLFFIPGFASNYIIWGTYPSLAGGGLPMLHDLFLAQGTTPSFDLVRLPCAAAAFTAAVPCSLWDPAHSLSVQTILKYCS